MNTHIHIKRIAQTREATLGVWCENGIPRYCTCEPPNNLNEPFQSCILPGTYEWVAVVTERFGLTILIKNVYNRDDILVHVGNKRSATNGCILIGTGWLYMGVADSAEAMDEFTLILEEGDSGYITITENF